MSTRKRSQIKGKMASGLVPQIAPRPNHAPVWLSMQTQLVSQEAREPSVTPPHQRPTSPGYPGGAISDFLCFFFCCWGNRAQFRTLLPNGAMEFL